jgi:nucleotide-binding universal stress UspA family protein
MIERILVPLDGSPLSEAILLQIRRLLKLTDAEVVLLRSVEVPPLEAAYETLLARNRKESDEYLTRMEQRLIAEGVRARHLVRAGPPAELILDVAAEERASLVAMATHGRTGLARFIRGSVTEKVLRSSAVPVLAVHSFQGATELPFRRIVVPVDGSETSLQVLPHVAELARPLQAHVLLLYVIEDPAHSGPTALRAATDRLSGARVDHSSEVVTGDPASEILDACKRMGADLLAMTTHGRAGPARWVMGSVTEKVLRHSTCPVLVVRAHKPA